jgi:raffinose/stachyose/melibiose transport system substrate-binding protein
MGAFSPPPPAGQDTCYISDHTDIALGINTTSPNQEAARTFLEWMTTAEFAELYTNQLPGFFTLSNHAINVEDPVAQEFISWRGECETTIRSSYQILSRDPELNNENDLWNVSAQVLNLTLTPQEAADFVQSRLATWYAPQQ